MDRKNPTFHQIAEKLWMKMGWNGMFSQLLTPCWPPSNFPGFLPIFTLIRRENAVFGDSPEGHKMPENGLNENI